MQVILMGLHGDASAASVAQGLGPFFHVQHVQMVTEGTPDSPWALVDVADSYERVWNVCNQLRGVFHRGKRIHFYIPLHQTDVFHEIPAEACIHIP
jgi:hypothetical protein